MPTNGFSNQTTNIKVKLLAGEQSSQPRIHTLTGGGFFTDTSLRPRNFVPPLSRLVASLGTLNLKRAPSIFFSATELEVHLKGAPPQTGFGVLLVFCDTPFVRGHPEKGTLRLKMMSNRARTNSPGLHFVLPRPCKAVRPGHF